MLGLQTCRLRNRGHRLCQILSLLSFLALNLLCRTGRFEAHIWDCGKQVYLGTALNFGFKAIRSISKVCQGARACVSYEMN